MKGLMSDIKIVNEQCHFCSIKHLQPCQMTAVV